VDGRWFSVNDIFIWVLVGALGGAYVFYKKFMKPSSKYNFSEKVTDFMLTPRKTVEKKTLDDTDADSYERNSGIYKVKSFVLNNGDKIMIHSEDNPVPHGLSSKEKENMKGEKLDISVNLAGRSFLTSALDNLTDVDRGSSFSLLGLLKKIPGQVYIVIMVLIIMVFG
jgi:hypothetical protein